MSRVNVTLREFFTSPGNALVTVTSVLVSSLNVITGSTGVLPGAISKRTDANGVAQFDLMTGRYRVSAVSSLATGGLIYSEVIDVEDDNLTYEHTELIVDGAGTFTPVIGNGSPDAAEAVAGLIKLATGADAEAAPRVVYTKAQVDVLLGSLGGGGSGGLKQANTISLVRGISSALLNAAGGALVWNTDGNGGGIYRFKLGGSEADDGNLYVRPSDYAGAGVNQGTLEKFIG